MARDKDFHFDWRVIDFNLDRTDAIFYTGESYIGTATYKGFYVDVYCDGETNAVLLDQPNGEIVSHLYSRSDFISAGIDTDDALSMAMEQEILIFSNNSWFDLYCEGEHIDFVTHTISEALDAAESFLKEQYQDEQNLMKEFDTAR